MKKKIAGIVAALAASVSLMAFAGPASAVSSCDYSEPDLQYACNLFDSYAGRDFDQPEAAYWAGVGQQYGHVIESLALIHSVEFDTIVVDAVYEAILDRAGDPAGMQYWTNQVVSDSLGYEDIIGIFGQSDEGQAALSNDDFTTLLYNAFLGRDPSAEELSYWNGIATDVGRHAVAIGIVHSDEAAARIIPLIYQAYLGRDATAEDVAYWTPIYQHLGYLDTIAVIAGSDEAFANLSQVSAVATAGAVQSLARLA